MAEWTQTTEQEFRQNLVARLVARSALTDIAEGSLGAGIMATAAEEFAAGAQAQRDALNSDFLDVSGARLDAACASLKQGGVTRLGPSAATGTVLTLTRTSTVAEETVNAGATFGRSDNSSLIYSSVAAVTYAIGVASASITVVCNTRGSIGNCPAATINTILDGVPDGFDTVTQDSSLGGGVDRETDEAYRTRARLFLASTQGGGQAAALRYLALTFKSTTGVRARHAQVYESPDLPAYCELVVDDGTAFAGYTRAGLNASGTFKNSGRVAYIEAPCVDDNLGTGQITINGSPATLDSSGAAQWVTKSETGEVWFSSSFVSNGTTWAIADYNVFTGFIAELQLVVLGKSTNPLTGLGWSDAGQRVRVVPPTQDLAYFSLNIVLADGAVAATVSAQCREVLTEYCASLGPGEQWQLMDAYAALNEIPGLVNATFRTETQDGVPTIYQDSPPTSDRSCIRLHFFEAV